MRTVAGNILEYPDLTTGEILQRVRPCSPGFLYCPQDKTTLALFCKRRLCEFCGKFWAQRWRLALKLRADNAVAQSLPDARLALTLTCAQQVGYIQMQNALRQFWKLLRADYPGLEYCGVVEFNQRHTQPHLHFVLTQYDFVDYKLIQKAWLTAQKRAGIIKQAFILRVEKIKGNAAAYFTKYVTKLTGGKDEIPRKELWAGRYVRYSRKFFPVPVAAMAAAARFNSLVEADAAFKRYVVNMRFTKTDLYPFIIRQDEYTVLMNADVNAAWQPAVDAARACIYSELHPFANATPLPTLPTVELLPL